MAYQHIRLELSPAAVATLTIARPDTLNALIRADARRAARRRSRSAADCGARCLLLTGEGRGFSSGADLAARRRPSRGCRRGARERISIP